MQIEATRNAHQTAAQQYEAVLQEFPEVCNGIGKLPGEYHIHLQPGVKPTVTAPRRVPSAREKAVKAEFERMEENGIIKRVTGPTDWVRSIVIIKKERWKCANLLGSEELKCSSEAAPVSHPCPRRSVCTIKQ